MLVLFFAHMSFMVNAHSMQSQSRGCNTINNNYILQFDKRFLSCQVADNMQ